MFRTAERLELVLLLTAILTLSARAGLAQAPTAPRAQASLMHSSSSVATATPSRKPKAHSKKAAPRLEVPEAPPPALTLEQQPPAAPQVSYRNGELSINSQNATLLQVLYGVRAQIGASVDLPPGAGSERVVANLGPGRPVDVLSRLLNGSRFNYMIVGTPGNSGGVQKIILLAKNTSPGTASAAQNGMSQTSPPPGEEPVEDQSAGNAAEATNLTTPGKPDVPSNGQVSTDASTNAGQDQAQPQTPTPEQMMQQYMMMRQRALQAQQAQTPGAATANPSAR